MSANKAGGGTCLKCGHEWGLDPVYAVPCPACGAAVGVLCVRPSEHRVSRNFWRGWHADRDLAAARAGAYHHACKQPCPKSCGVCNPPAPVVPLQALLGTDPAQGVLL